MYFFFRRRVLCVGLADLEFFLLDLNSHYVPAPASQMLELKVFATTALPLLYIF